MGLIFAERRKGLMDLARAQMKSSVGFCIAHVIEMEVTTLGPRGLPLRENMTAIGQWAPLVDAAFAMIASIIQWNVSETFRGKDIEKASRIPDSNTLRKTAQKVSTPALKTPTGVFDTTVYFEEGYLWGSGADALPDMEHEGVSSGLFGRDI
ncbi:hypothetical protein CVT25_014525 [Psilocybe cyanescens]|uniref:Uncharacterized protein n=1 Tax=Psilocybe cyanescens TaxID=93625 RepID=A0A409WR99_PSICY|nr:hypothetical protein CVT25_014525 [Psilocybe cyanescens]